MIAFIGGTSLIDSAIFQTWSEKKIKTPFGTVTLKKDGDSYFLQRHGYPPLPPHKINHKANVWALKSIGAKRIIAVNSVGSLRLSIRPGSFLVPDDFLSFCDTVTFFDLEMRFMVPRMDAEFAARLHERCKALKMPIRCGGVYVQTRGPRLETRAEIKMLQQYGDIVGMTMASEVTLCLEYELPYANLCSIDNYCHGIAKKPLSMDEILENVTKNRQSIEKMIVSIHRERLE
jgi:5'-methylthioadenosine phosphorylase